MGARCSINFNKTNPRKVAEIIGAATFDGKLLKTLKTAELRHAVVYLQDRIKEQHEEIQRLSKGNLQIYSKGKTPGTLRRNAPGQNLGDNPKV